MIRRYAAQVRISSLIPFKTGPSREAIVNRPEFPAPVTFGDFREAYSHKSVAGLLHSLAVLRLCSVQWITLNSIPILTALERVLGETLTYHTFVKWTMFQQFCAGENETDIKKSLNKLAKVNVGSILDYAAEADVPGAVKGNEKPDINMKSLLWKGDVQYKMEKDYYDSNMKLYILCVAHASLNKWQFGKGFAAVKLTGLMNPQLLARANSVLLHIRQSWIRLFYEQESRIPVLEECRILISRDDVEVPAEVSVHAPVAMVRAGLQRLAKGKLSESELDSIIEVLDPHKKGRVNYYHYTSIIGKCVSNVDTTRDDEILAPLLKHFPQLSAEETRIWGHGKHRISTICRVASELSVGVMIDAEQTFYQMAIDHVVRGLQREFNKEEAIVYNTYQCYLKITPARVHNDIDRAKMEGWVFAGKMVRGAYMVQERVTAEEFGYVSPIHESKENTDACYDSAVSSVLDVIEKEPRTSILLGTHNQNSIELVTKRIVDTKLRQSNIAFAQLYGMADHLSVPLAKAGYNVFKYVPYGPIKETLHYLSRRAQENSSLLGADLPEVAMQWNELRRRVGLQPKK